MAESTLIEDPDTTTVGPRRVSPAAHLAEAFAAAEVSGARGARLREVPFVTMVGLRVVIATAGAGALERVLGTPLPIACGDVARSGGQSVLWLSPDEFLVVSDREPIEVTRALRDALADEPGSVIDLSANRTTFELSGPSARGVLEKGCALDLHPRAFPADHAYVTGIGSVPVIVWKPSEETYRILPRSSFADFLGRWLLDAMIEFKAPEIA